ncbi:hypothetical protein SLS62_008919 [Diatrype stigma]|uniref:Uncharacterized protein n=1 Tax=Diatrype stigma TaxID=117547 RepID=A0AAN9UJM2_9PEZI
MAPSHLHPRSRMTSSLFATTVLASFFVVALPHVLPCPAPPRVAYADSSSSSSDPAADEIVITTTTIANPDGTTSTVKRRRRVPRGRKEEQGEEEGEVRNGIVAFEARGGQEEEGRIIPAGAGRRGHLQAPPRGRECPVPKPGGVIGELMGFNNSNNKKQQVTISGRDDSSSSSNDHKSDSGSSRSSGSGGGDET